MQRTFVIGDIHGFHDALVRVLKKSGFDYENDKLIILGDLGDRGKHTKQVIDELLKIKHKVLVLGNHDLWLLKWFDGEIDPNWDMNGGEQTRKSYKDGVPALHKAFLRSGKPFYVEEMILDGRKQHVLFVHGGFDPDVPIQDQSVNDLAWNRTLFRTAAEHKIPGYDLIFIGHNRTVHTDHGGTKPLMFHNLIMLDTGIDAGGRLSMMELSTGKLFQDHD